MGYRSSIEEKQGVLWVTITGTRTLEGVLTMTKDVFDSCKEKGLKQALVDVRSFGGHLGTMEAYDLVTRQFPKMRDPSVLTKAAIVDRKEEVHKDRFFETVAVNRGFRVRIFADTEDALQWLKE